MATRIYRERGKRYLSIRILVFGFFFDLLGIRDDGIRICGSIASKVNLGLSTPTQFIEETRFVGPSYGRLYDRFTMGSLKKHIIKKGVMAVERPNANLESNFDGFLRITS